jgi:pimeloyl-ACP methyl ester carboxylesterase
MGAMDSLSASAGPVTAERLSLIHVLSDGRRVGYADYGDPRGLPVFALHGTPGSRFMFALADLAARERGLRLIAPERPGYGLSGYRRHASLFDHATDIIALADALGIGRFAVIGVSGGGPYAVATAATAPGRIALLALVGPMGPIADCGRQIRMSSRHRLLFGTLARWPLAIGAFFQGLRALLRRAPDLAYRGLMARVPLTDRKVLARDDVRASLHAAVGEGLRGGIDGAMQDVRLFCAPWGLPLSRLDASSVLWQGSDDNIVPPEAAYWLADTLPNCRLDVIQGAGHYWVFGQFGMVLDAAAAAMRT